MSKQPTPAPAPAPAVLTPDEAFVDLLNDIGNVSADKVNSHLRNRYSSLANILEYLKPILAAHGFAIFTPSSTSEGVLSVTLQIRHRSGHVFDGGRQAIKVDGLTGQQIGSQTTYLRRQLIQLALNFSTDTDIDDDGHAAATASKPSGMPATASAPAKPATTLFPPKPGL